jgi:hypothetical protein
MKKLSLGWLEISVCVYSRDEYARFASDYNLSADFPEGCEGLSIGNGIWIGRATVNTIAHEVNHACRAIFCDIFEMKKSAIIGSELSARLSGFLVEKIVEHFKKIEEFEG